MVYLHCSLKKSKKKIASVSKNNFDDYLLYISEPLLNIINVVLKIK